MNIWIPIIITIIANLAIIIVPVIANRETPPNLQGWYTNNFRIVLAMFLSIVIIGFWIAYFCM